MTRERIFFLLVAASHLIWQCCSGRPSTTSSSILRGTRGSSVCRGEGSYLLCNPASLTKLWIQLFIFGSQHLLYWNSCIVKLLPTDILQELLLSIPGASSSHVYILCCLHINKPIYNTRESVFHMRSTLFMFTVASHVFLIVMWVFVCADLKSHWLSKRQIGGRSKREFTHHNKLDYHHRNKLGGLQARMSPLLPW